MKKLALLIALGACAGIPRTGTTTAALATAPGPHDDGAWHPDDFGAHPTPSGSAMLDARPGIQATLDAAGDYSTVKLGCGRWEVSRAPIGSYDRVASIAVHTHHVVLTGSGPCTIFAPTGDAGQGDWRGIDVTGGAEDVTIRDLVIDTTGLTNTSEQTHAIEATGPVNGLRLERVTFIHPRRTTDRVGDCLRLLGNGAVLNPDGSIKTPAALVENVSVLDSTFAVCARSGIGVQRGEWGLQVIGSRFLDIEKTPIDNEPTSTGGNGDEVFIGNIFKDTNATHPGGQAVSIGGFDAPIEHVKLIGNVFDHRGIGAYRVANLTMLGNSVNCDWVVDQAPCVNVENVGYTWTLADNDIRRGAGDGTTAMAGPVVRIIHHGSSPSSSRAQLHHNFMTQEAATHSVWVESAQDLTVDHNDVLYANASTTWTQGLAAFFFRATAAPLDMLEVDHNRVRSTTAGALAASVYVAASPMNVGIVSVTGNESTGVDQGLRCSNTTTGKFTTAVVLGGNFFANLGHAVAWSCPTSVVATIAPQVP